MTLVAPVETRAVTRPPLVSARVVSVVSLAFAATQVPVALAATRSAWLPTLQLVLTVTAYGATCFWLERSREFALAAAPEFRHARGSAGLWLGWLVPILDWWFPYQAVRDIRTATSRGVRTGGLTKLWWAGFLALTISSDARWAQASTQSWGEGTSTPYDVVGAIALLVALVPWLRIVREISTDQRALSAARR